MLADCFSILLGILLLSKTRRPVKFWRACIVFPQHAIDATCLASSVALPIVRINILNQRSVR